MTAFYLILGAGFFLGCIATVQKAFGRVQP